MKKVVTFGEIMLRLGAPDYLRLTQCHQLDMTYAGKILGGHLRRC